MATRTFTAIIRRENGGYVANSPEAGITSKGATIEEALDTLKEATRRIVDRLPLPATGSPILATYEVEFKGRTDISDSAELAQQLQGIAQQHDWLEEQNDNEPVAEPGPMTAQALLDSGLVGLWAHRTDITDSSEYARQLRDRLSERLRG